MASVPGPPILTYKKPDVRSGQMKFFWSPPTSDGGSPITSYNLTDGTNEYTISSNQLWYLVKGLTNGVTYSFQIAASNDIGLGPYETYNSAQPCTYPDPPIPSSVTLVTDKTYDIAWLTPTNTGGSTELLGTLLTAYALDDVGNISTNSTLWIKQTLLGGPPNTLQTFRFALNSNTNFRILLDAVNDAGYSFHTAFTSTISSAYNAPFSPSSITGVQIWLDADDSTTFTFGTNVSSVTQWRDKSGYSRHAIPLQGQPFYSNTAFSNTKPGVVFWNASTLYTPIAPNTFPSSSHFFVVFQKTSTAFGRAGDTVISRSSNNAPAPFDVYNTTRYWGNQTLGNTTVNFNLSQASNMNNWNFNVSSNAWNEYLNGSTISSFTISGYADTSSNFYIGTRQDLQTGFRGYIGEIIGYNKSLSVTERQTIEGYLGWKWGLSTLLPFWHPFYSRAPLPSDSVLDFSPSSIAGVKLWLDAADPTTFVVSSATSTILRWNDKSGAGNNMLASGTPILSTNFVHMNGTNAYFSTVGFTEPAVTNMFVFNQAGGVGWIYTTRTDVATNGLVTNGGGFFYYDVGANGWGPSMSVMPLNTLQMVESQYNGNVAGSTIVMYSNANIYTTSSLVNSTIRNQFFLGSRQVPGNLDYFSGRFYEVLHFSTILSLTQRQQAEGYLAWKWGLQSRLPSTHLYYYRPPTRKDVFTSFSPSSIPGLAIWADASLLPQSDGTAITTFSTSSFIGFNGNMTVKTNVLNSKSVVQLTTAQSMSTITPSDYSTTYFGMFMVTRTLGSNNQRVFQGSVNDVYGYYRNGGKPVFYTSNAGFIIQGNAGYNTNWDMFSFTRSQISTIVNWNGSNVAGTTQTPIINGINVNRGSGENSDCQVAEFFLYSTPITYTQALQVEGYLAWKWGLQSNLPVTHPYRLASTISLAPISSVNTF